MSGGRIEKSDALPSSFISDHGCIMETSFHVHSRRNEVGRGKSTFMMRMLRNAAAMIDPPPPPEKITWCYGEWQPAYAMIDLIDMRLEEGLRSATMFDSATRNLNIINDLMSETDERVTTLFPKKSSQEHVRAVSRTEPVP